MAVIAAKHEVRDNGMVVVTWEALGENGGVRDTGNPVTLAGVWDLTVQAVGNFDTSCTVTIQGSNDGTNWVDIAASGGAMAATGAIRFVTVRPLFIRPAITADGAADASDIDVILVAAVRK